MLPGYYIEDVCESQSLQPSGEDIPTFNYVWKPLNLISSDVQILETSIANNWCWFNGYRQLSCLYFYF